MLYMKAFFESSQNEEIVQEVLAQTSWFHNCVILLLGRLREYYGQERCGANVQQV